MLTRKPVLPILWFTGPLLVVAMGLACGKLPDGFGAYAWPDSEWSPR